MRVESVLVMLNENYGEYNLENINALKSLSTLADTKWKFSFNFSTGVTML